MKKDDIVLSDSEFKKLILDLIIQNNTELETIKDLLIKTASKGDPKIQSELGQFYYERRSINLNNLIDLYFNKEEEE